MGALLDSGVQEMGLEKEGVPRSVQEAIHFEAGGVRAVSISTGYKNTMTRVTFNTVIHPYKCSESSGANDENDGHSCSSVPTHIIKGHSEK